MISFSKELFYEIVTPDIACDVLHPWCSNCLNASMLLFFDCFYGSAKFMLPLWLVRLFYNRKRLDRRAFKKQLSYYVRSVLFFSLYSSSLLTLNCCIRAITGKFDYYVVGVLCGTLAGLNIFIETNEMRAGKCLLFTNLVIENVIKFLEDRRIIRRTLFKETTCFATFTAILMYLFVTTEGAHKLDMLWFFAPNSLKDINDDKGANYNDSLKGFAKYFAIGYAMELITNVLRNRKLILKSRSTFFIHLFRTIFATNNLGFGLFLGGFVGTFKSLMCYFNRQHVIERRQRKNNMYNMQNYAAIAGLIAGFTYYLKPNVSFNVMAFTTIIQVLVYKYWKNLNFKESNLMKVPYVELWTALMAGIIIHHRILHADICVNYVLKVLDLLSNNRFTYIHSNFIVHVTSKAL